MRRALGVFYEMNHLLEKQEGETERYISNIVYMDFDDEDEAKEVSQDEVLVIYRGLIRASGIWQFPGMQR